MYVDADNLDHGLLYDHQHGMWIDVDCPSRASAVPYGPSAINYSEQRPTTAFCSTRTAQCAPGDYPGATNTIPRNTFNGLVVGN